MAVLNSKLHIQNAYYYGTFQPVPEPEGIYSTVLVIKNFKHFLFLTLTENNASLLQTLWS
jgi:hypothetical protein